ncbi:hypothetical protein [Psychroflexus sediminis]|uniref:Uncharacterized protein n=1 Tax=Psychroflexus sediminis TaxID=470826 RepID=A0A1G7VZK1_9FLAO|nr:hypothetical protein [Psychroflexus sediminis]SDG64320.1 hypothetical protein SAMN04488027_104230 [Psychroflexus sediminis]
MEANQTLTTKNKKVKLVDGEFTPTQASDILNALIDQKINYHKIENLQHWEQNHNNDSKPFITRIQALEKEKEAVDRYISEIRKEGKKISINGIITLNSID